MKAKKAFVALIVVAFLICALFSCYFLFSINKVSVSYTVADNTDTSAIQTKLDNYVGENILFFKTDKVYSVVEDNPYFKVTSVEKKYPNVLQIKVEERKEVFYLEHEDSVYLLDETGFILNKVALIDFDGASSRDIIELDFHSYIGEESIVNATVGNYLKTVDDKLFNCVLEMARSIDLYDRVSRVTVNTGSRMDRGADFDMYSGGSLKVINAIDRGVLQIKTALVVYDSQSDFVKADCNVKVYILKDSGLIDVAVTKK